MMYVNKENVNSLVFFWHYCDDTNYVYDKLEVVDETIRCNNGSFCNIEVAKLNRLVMVGCVFATMDFDFNIWCY